MYEKCSDFQNRLQLSLYSVEYLTLAIYHMYAQALFIYREHREARLRAAKLSAVNSLYATASCGRGVYDIVNLAVALADVLEVVNMSAEVDIDLVLISAKDAIYALLHICSLLAALARIGIYRVVTDNDNPIFSGAAKHRL